MSSIGFPGPIGSKGTGVYEDARLTNELGEYELQRMRRIAKNEAYLDKLGLGRAGASTINMIKATKQKHTKQHKVWVKPGEERRSSRVKKDNKNLMQLSYEESDGFDRATKVYDSEEDEEMDDEEREKQVREEPAKQARSKREEPAR